jgi:hypothetical protein
MRDEFKNDIIAFLSGSQDGQSFYNDRLVDRKATIYGAIKSFDLDIITKYS